MCFEGSEWKRFAYDFTHLDRWMSSEFVSTRMLAWKISQKFRIIDFSILRTLLVIAGHRNRER